jgi:hypothetical protein
LNAITLGIERMSNACDSAEFSSTLTLTSLMPPPKALGDLIEHRPERAAWAAPRRPEVDHDGNLFRSFEHFVLEGS